MGKDLWKILRKINFIIFVILLFTLCVNSFALPFNVEPKAGTTLPSTVNVGSTVSAYYTVSNNTQAQRNDNAVKYLPPNVTQVTSGSGICGATFNLAGKGQAGDSCTLQLTISGPVDANDPDPHHHLFVCFPGGLTCAGTLYPLNVTQTSGKTLTSIAITPGSATIYSGTTQSFSATATYSDGSTTSVTSSVAWNSSNSSVASISSSGLATGLSGGVSNITASLNSITSNTAVLTVNNGFAYISDSGNSDIYSCPLQNDGSLGSCSIQDSSLPASAFNFAINSTKTRLYETIRTPSKVYFCNINFDGSVTNCIDTGGNLGSLTPAAIAINPTNTIAYVTENNFPINFYNYCVINSDGSFGTCTPDTIPGTSHGITINPSGTVAYLTVDSTNTLYACPINGNGSLGSCIATAGASLNVPTGVAIHPTLSHIYVVNSGNNTLVNCDISNDIIVSNCVLTATSSTPSRIAINPLGTLAYLLNATGIVDICSINQSTGTISSCTPALSGVSNTFGLGIT